MGKRSGTVAALALAAAVATVAGSAEAAHPHPPADPHPDAYVGLSGGAAVPIGAWSTGKDLEASPEFFTGGGGRVTLGWAPLDSGLFAVQAEAGYARNGAESPDAPGFARFWSFALGGTLNLPARGRSPYALELHGALGVLAPSGGTSGGARYDFLETTLFGRTGARFVTRFETGLEAYAGLDFLTAPGGVDHPGQEKRAIMSLEPALGLRYWFGL